MLTWKYCKHYVGLERFLNCRGLAFGVPSRVGNPLTPRRAGAGNITKCFPTMQSFLSIRNT